jgi:5-methyltetrahydropteroyltriglutamate--homocysteine methyltransferase
VSDRARTARRNRIGNPPKAIGPVRYVHPEAAASECNMFRSALSGASRKPAEAFMTAASPGIIATTMVNECYDSYETYVFALTDELRKEYEIAAARTGKAQRLPRTDIIGAN